MIEAARRNDPVQRLGAHLAALGLWDDDAQVATETAAMARIDEAFEMALTTPLAPDAVLDHCLTQDTQRMVRQRESLLGTPEAGR